MKTIFRALALLGLLSIAAGVRAQTIATMTGTIVDPVGIPYANGQVTINIAPPGVTSPFITATNAVILFPILTSTNAAGSFSVQLLTNASISPGGTQYTFRICAAAPIPPPLGTGNSCFTPAPVTITASGDLSATFNPSAPALANSFFTPGSSFLNFQGPAAAITGTGAAATFYTFTLAANALPINRCLRITSVTQHPTGTTSALLSISFGGTSNTSLGDDPIVNLNSQTKMVYEICNNGSTSAQTITSTQVRGNAGTAFGRFDTAAVNTANPVIINLQFNVAATDQVKPSMLLIELIK